MPPLFILDHLTIHQNSGFPVRTCLTSNLCLWLCSHHASDNLISDLWSPVSCPWNRIFVMDQQTFCRKRVPWKPHWFDATNVFDSSFILTALLSIHIFRLSLWIHISDLPENTCVILYWLSLWNIYRLLCLNKTCPLEIEEKQTKKGNISNTYFAAISQQFFVISF